MVAAYLVCKGRGAEQRALAFTVATDPFPNALQVDCTRAWDILYLAFMYMFGRAVSRSYSACCGALWLELSSPPSPINLARMAGPEVKCVGTSATL